MLPILQINRLLGLEHDLMPFPDYPQRDQGILIHP